MSEQHRTLTLTSPEHSCDVARALATRLGPGHVILLEGDIGAGKTHIARCLIKAMIAEDEDVPSPTFTLVQSYEVDTTEIWHADLYRLSSPDEVVELGLLDAFDTALCLVEWPDRLADLRPKSALLLSLSMTEQAGERRAEFRWTDPIWTNILEATLT